MGLRQMCSVISPVSEEPHQRMRVQLQPQPHRALVSEAELEEMFEFAAEDVEDISDHWDETMEVNTEW